MVSLSSNDVMIPENWSPVTSPSSWRWLGRSICGGCASLSLSTRLARLSLDGLIPELVLRMLDRTHREDIFWLRVNIDINLVKQSPSPGLTRPLHAYVPRLVWGEIYLPQRILWVVNHFLAKLLIKFVINQKLIRFFDDLEKIFW